MLILAERNLIEDILELLSKNYSDRELYFFSREKLKYSNLEREKMCECFVIHD
jgi:hypothetical protein